MKIFPLISLALLSLASASASAASCSRADVDHYLKSGFSHGQIVQLCGQSKAAAPAPRAPAAVGSAPMGYSPNNVLTEESVFFKSSIEAKQVDIMPDQVVYVRRECLKFGLPDMTGEKEETCRDIRTSIKYQGLRMIQADDGIPLIKERVLLMGGDITREVVRPESIIARHKKDFWEDFVKNPSQINIPVRKGYQTQVVGQRLADKGR